MILRDWPPKVQEDCRTVPVTLRYNGTSAYRSLPLHQRCEANGPTSGHPIIIGAGLGGTATRSVAAAVRRLGFATCHWTGGNHDALFDASRSGDVIGPFSEDAKKEPESRSWPTAGCQDVDTGDSGAQE